ncbi:MAG: DUF6452 family protein [Flavobacteriaceae bacterium]
MSYFWRSYRPMYKQKIAFIVFLGILAFSSCEKDDICVDGNTPLLIIRFYDSADTTLVKSVPNMVVRGIIGQDSLLPIIPNASGDSIAIPLRSDAGTTRFLISQNPTPSDTTQVKADTLTFNYGTQSLFVSRACGFIANYAELGVELDAENEPWIQAINIVNPSIENSSSAHVKIFH